MDAVRIKQLLSENFPESHIAVGDPHGNGYLFEVTVHSTLFNGKTRVQQHQMVYNVLKTHIDDGVLHAITVKTKACE